MTRAVLRRPYCHVRDSGPDGEGINKNKGRQAKSLHAQILKEWVGVQYNAHQIEQSWEAFKSLIISPSERRRHETRGSLIFYIFDLNNTVCYTKSAQIDP